MVDPRELLKCEGCGKLMTVEETDVTVIDMGVIMGLGGPMPYGGCPDCGCKVYSQRVLNEKEEEHDGGQENSGQC